MKSPILVTGATGYIGSRLVQYLARQHAAVRVMVRRRDWINRFQVIFPEIDVVVADVTDPISLRAALNDVHCAVYLIHSIGQSKRFWELEQECARRFAQEAYAAGVQSIVYLGGLADDSDPNLSTHLKSRIGVGQIMSEYHPNVIELRASIILGAGSVSFELIRSLVHRLPVMIAPRWVSQLTQPIDVDDAIRYLAQAIDHPEIGPTVIEIGGPDTVSYRGLMTTYAEETGRKRWIIPVPVLTPWVSSLWLGLVTPVYARIGRKLIESLRNPSVVRVPSTLLRVTPPPIDYRTSIRRIIDQLPEPTDAWWFHARSSVGQAAEMGPISAHRFSMVFERQIVGSVQSIDRVIRQFGGKSGYFYAEWLWKLRGWIDLLLGGAGHARTIGYTSELIEEGDVVGWWRATHVRPGQTLQLLSEMRLSGVATLTFDIIPTESTTQWRVRMRAELRTSTWLGKLYWWVLAPIHYVLFPNVLRGIADQVSNLKE